MWFGDSLLFVSLLTSQIVPVDTSTAAAHPVLVELFTSEGCSSCPPADALLETWDSSQPFPGTELIVLSEHVDYWDHDGWKDPSSSAAMTERQAAYVRALGLETPYTPQIIVDGTAVLRTDDRQQINQVFHDRAGAPKDPVQISSVSVDSSSGVIRARIEADGVSNKGDADVYVSIAFGRIESQVLHGENSGRRLTHVSVVQQLAEIGKLRKGMTFNKTIKLKLKSGTDVKNVRVIAFVQEPGPGRLLGAALWKGAP